MSSETDGKEKIVGFCSVCNSNRSYPFKLRPLGVALCDTFHFYKKSMRNFWSFYSFVSAMAKWYGFRYADILVSSVCDSCCGRFGGIINVWCFLDEILLEKKKFSAFLARSEKREKRMSPSEKFTKSTFKDWFRAIAFFSLIYEMRGSYYDPLWNNFGRLRCAYCQIPLVMFEADFSDSLRNTFKKHGHSGLEILVHEHFVPISQGGKTVSGNLFPSCRKCNKEKAETDPIDWLIKTKPFDSGIAVSAWMWRCEHPTFQDLAYGLKKAMRQKSHDVRPFLQYDFFYTRIGGTFLPRFTEWFELTNDGFRFRLKFIEMIEECLFCFDKFSDDFLKLLDVSDSHGWNPPWEPMKPKIKLNEDLSWIQPSLLTGHFKDLRCVVAADH